MGTRVQYWKQVIADMEARMKKARECGQIGLAHSIDAKLDIAYSNLAGATEAEAEANFYRNDY